MQFTTPVPVAQSQNPIGYGSKIVSLGSCFAVNIAEKFDYFKFQNNCNPFGILFHPLAILEIIRRSVLDEKFTASDLVQDQGLWHCLDAHSDLSHPNPSELLDNLNTARQTTRAALQNATHLVLTYGTAWVYRYKSSGKVVANCHKIAQWKFEKELLPIASIRAAIDQTLQLVQDFNTSCRVIVTVSPVRHLKDGFVENQRSKAHLIAAIHDFTDAAFDYFPSYEIVMDELRDYRFYAADMLHPNPTAIDYIWERFSDSHIAPEAKMVMSEIDGIQKGLRHKPFHPESDSHRQFLDKLNTRIAVLQKQLPHLQF